MPSPDCSTTYRSPPSAPTSRMPTRRGSLKRRGAACGVEHGGAWGRLAGRQTRATSLRGRCPWRSIARTGHRRSVVGGRHSARRAASPGHTVHVSSPHVGFPPSLWRGPSSHPAAPAATPLRLRRRLRTRPTTKSTPLAARRRPNPTTPQAGSPAAGSRRVPTVEPSGARSEAVIGTGPAASARTSTRTVALLCAPR